MTQADNATATDALINTNRLLGKVVEVEQQKLRVPLGSRINAIRKWLRQVYNRIWQPRPHFPL